MPKDVDHDERREELARGGLAGGRPRRPGGRHDPRHRPRDRLVGRARWPTTSPTRTTSWSPRCDSPTSGSPRGGTRKLEGLDGMPRCASWCSTTCPLDDERELETKFLMNYWSRAIRGGDGVPRPARRGPLLIDRLTTLARDGQDRRRDHGRPHARGHRRAAAGTDRRIQPARAARPRAADAASARSH